MRYTPGRAAAVARAHFATCDARRRFVAIRGGRSQRQLARQLRVTHSVVQRFERGHAPGLDLLLSLGLAGVRLEWLFFGQGPCTSEKPADWLSISGLDFELWETVAL